MNITINKLEKGIRALLSGPFTFADHQQFKEIIDLTAEDGMSSLELDFGHVNFIDSAGLGMLLLLRDVCQNKHISVSIHAAAGQVEKIFLISKFDQLFRINP